MVTAEWATLQLAEFVAAVSTADTEVRAARAAVERAAEALDADVAAIVSGGKLVAAVGYPHGGAPAAELAGVQPGVAGARLHVPGVGSCPAAAATLGHPHGATLVVARQGPDGLTREETALLGGMARVAAITMRMLGVVDDERAARELLARLAQEQAALRRVATLVAKAAVPEEIFSAVAAEVAQLSAADMTRVLRYEPEGMATVVGGWGEPEAALALGTRLSVRGESVAVSVLHTGRPARTVGFAGPPGSVADAFGRAGARAGCGSPIVVEGQLWGVVIASTRDESLAADTEARLAGFTELVATAIANAQARVELRRIADEQAALRQVATLVARAAPPAEVFAAVAAEVGRLLGCDFTVLSRYEPQDSATVVGRWSSTGAVVPTPVGTRFELGGRNVTSQVFRTGRSVRMDDYRAASGPAAAIARDWGFCSSIGAPINVAGRLWGIILVAYASKQPLLADAEARLTGFTELVATAIANAQAREELRGFADEQAALRRVATLVAHATPLSEVFAAVVGEVGRLVPVESTLLARYEPGSTIVSVGAWSRTAGALATGYRHALGRQDVATLVARSHRPVRLDSSGDGADAVLATGMRLNLGVPITVAGRLWGVMIVAATRAEPLPTDTETRLAGFTDLVATAIANAEANAELTASRARIVATADQTRRRIERDLHDGAQQRLVSLTLQLRKARAALPAEFAGVTAEIDSAAAGLTSALNELQEIARGIHPAILAEGGLVPALRTLARRAAVPVNLDVRTRARLPERIEITAYYIVSEALANAAKHANASVVHVALDATDELVTLTVGDDGIGGADPSRGSGLVGLHDRVAAIGGTMLVRSAPGRGTCLVVELPTGADQRRRSTQR
jgi:signal transduction histidine kinase